MALNAIGIGIAFTAKDLASGVMHKVGKSFTDLHEKGSAAANGMNAAFGAFKTGIGILGAGLGVLAGAGVLAEKYGELDDALDSVANTTRATAEDLDLFEDAAHRVALATQFKPQQAVQAMEVLAKSFGSTKDAIDNVLPVMHLAGISMGRLGVAQAAQVAADTVKVFGLRADQTAEVVDKLAMAQKNTGLRADDFGRTLKRASTTAAQYGQSLDETLLSLGLLKGRGMESRMVMASFMQTMEKLAKDKGAQSALDSKQISVFDKSTGKMRAMTSVLLDVVAATEHMTEKERNEFVTRALGAKGMTAYDSVAKATFKTMEHGREVTLKGREAVEAMGRAMGVAGGEAARLNAQMLDDLGGQLEMIGAATDSVEKQLGKALGEVLKPAAEKLRDAIRSVGETLRANPGLRKFIGEAVIGAGVVLSLFGAFMAAASAMAIFTLGVKLIGGAVASAAAAMLPWIALFAVATAVVYGLRQAVDRNLGGIGDLVAGAIAKVRLAFQGLSQLFSQGGFSGAVRDEMRAAGNEGVRAFAITIYMWVGRIKNALTGLATGFSNAVAAAEPAFGAFAAALDRLGQAMGFALDAPADAQAKYDAWGAAGMRVGQILGDVLAAVVEAMTAVIEVTQGFLTGFRFLGPVLDVVVTAIGSVFSALGEVVDALTGADSATGSARSGWETFGLVVGAVAGAVGAVVGLMANSIAMALSVVGGAIDAVRALFVGFWGMLTGIVDAIVALLHGDFTGAWEAAKGVVFSWVEAILGILGGLVGGIASAIDKIGKLFGKNLGLKDAVKGFQNDLVASARDALGTDAQKRDAAAATAGAARRDAVRSGSAQPAGFIGPPVAPGFVPPAVGAAPTVGASPPPRGASQADIASAATSAATSAAVAAVGRIPPGMLSAVMTVDAEVLGRISAKYKSRGGAEGGSVDTPVET